MIDLGSYIGRYGVAEAGRHYCMNCYGSVKMIQFSYSNKDTKVEEGELRRETRLHPYTRHDASTLTLGTALQRELGGRPS